MSAVDFGKMPFLDDLIQASAHHPDAIGFSILLRAAREKRIAFTAITSRRTMWSPRSLKSSGPTVVLISDDAGKSCDPAQWRCAIGAIAWARCAMVHGTGGEAWQYEEAILAAERNKRCLIVETDSSHVAAWSAAIVPRQIPTLVFMPFPGGVHPVQASKGGHQ